MIGNPPFLGGKKFTGALGTAYREYLVDVIGRGARGSADLVAYFVLRAHELLNAGGQTGLIATNTLAQGDTREVGLDQLVADGVTIRRAIKSEPWPSRSAVLEYCAVWTSRAPVDDDAAPSEEGAVVGDITASLDVAARVVGTAHGVLRPTPACRSGLHTFLAWGSLWSPRRRSNSSSKDPRTADGAVPLPQWPGSQLPPGLLGEPWVINFHDWPRSGREPTPSAMTRCGRW